ncbi:unnamed protein product [Clonostachys byssicola]|uniref:Uncharacterized protein n=1 Tax=Clonostachys byssicola TaxID=160290 RepID=A0A9N9UYH2_9HYPO|nr:unnamed protein product [Clonostachys byssicola]
MIYDQCPRDLDIVIVGGPSKNHHPAAADNLGVLDSIEATINRPIHASAKEAHNKVRWVDKPWATSPKPFEGKSAVWTAGGGDAFAIPEGIGYEPGPQDYQDNTQR